MDGLLVLFAIVMWLVSKSDKKKKKSKSAMQKNHRNAAQYRADAVSQQQTEKEKNQPEVVQRQIPPKAQRAYAEGESGFLQTRPGLMETPYTGSLQAESMEGECICDPVLEHVREENTENKGVLANEIGGEPLVDFSAKGVLQGFVMSEILKRPSQRARYR